MRITSRAPVRVDFAGGWTDVGLFAEGAGGMVVNAAINHYVTGTLEARSLAEPLAMSQPSAPGIAPPGGEGLRVAYQSDLPSGSGLGTSSALNVIWLSLIRSQIDSDEDRAHLAELAYQLESMLGILGGKQDQYAAAYGGFNSMTFGKTAHVERLAITPAMVEELERRLVLCYTGKQRLSGSIHDNVWGAFRRGVPATVNALYALRECAHQARTALLNADVDALAQIMSDNWRHQCQLDASITNPQMDGLFETAIQAGAQGGKACGAGGGGCLLFCAQPGRQFALSDALAAEGAHIIPFQFDHTGLQVTREE